MFFVKERFVPPDNTNKENGPPQFHEIFKLKGFLIAVSVLFGVHLSNSTVNPSFPLIVKDIIPSHENLNTITGFILASAALSGALSAALLGHAGDRVGHKRIMVACSISASVSSIGHFFAFNIPTLVFVRILFGISLGGLLPAANTMIKNIAKSDFIGKAYGSANSISFMGLALGNFMGGAIAQATNLRIPFLVTAVFQLLLAIAVNKFVKINPK